MAESLERLVVRLEAESAKFQKGMEQAQRQLAKFDKSASVTAKSVATMQRAFLGLGAAAAGFKLASLTKSTLDYADSIGEAAGALGITTTAYQELAFATSQAGIKQDQFTASFSKFVQTAQDAASGNKKAMEVFAQLGIDAQTAGGDVEVLFDKVVEGLDQLPTQSARLAVIGDLFGAKVAAKWAATLSAGKQGLDEMRRAAEDWGLVLSKDAIEALGVLGDRTDALGAKFRIAFAEGLFEGITGEAKTFADILNDDGLKASIQAIARGIGEIGAATGAAARNAAEFVGWFTRDTFASRAAGVLAAGGAGAMAGGMVGGLPGAVVGGVGAAGFEAMAIAATADQNLIADRAYLRSGMSFIPGEGQSMIPEPGMSMIPDDFTPKAEAAAAAIAKTGDAAAKAAPEMRGLSDAYDLQSEAAEDAADWERELAYIYAQNEAAILGVTQEVLAYDQAIADLNLLLENGVISHQQYERAAAKAAESLDTYGNAVRGYTLNLREDVKQSTSNLFQNLITDGADWKDHLLNYFSQIGDAFARLAADMATQALFGTTGGGGGGGINWGALLGQAVGAAVGSMGGAGSGVAAIGTRGTGGPVLLASGGPLSAGQPAIIGEEGPELVLPRHAAQVFNADDTRSMLGGARVSQTFNIVAPDPNAFRGSERQIMRRSRAALGIA